MTSGGNGSVRCLDRPLRRVQFPEFGIRNSEFGIRNSEFGIRKKVMPARLFCQAKPKSFPAAPRPSAPHPVSLRTSPQAGAALRSSISIRRRSRHHNYSLFTIHFSFHHFPRSRPRQASPVGPLTPSHCAPARRLVRHSAPLFQSVGAADTIIVHYSLFTIHFITSPSRRP